MKWQIISGWMEHVDMPLDFYQKHISMRCDSKSPIDLYSSEKKPLWTRACQPTILTQS